MANEKICYYLNGEMPERSKGHAWKACVRANVPRVRIPLSPPLTRKATYVPATAWHKIRLNLSFFSNITSTYTPEMKIILLGKTRRSMEHKQHYHKQSKNDWIRVSRCWATSNDNRSEDPSPYHREIIMSKITQSALPASLKRPQHFHPTYAAISRS